MRVCVVYVCGGIDAVASTLIYISPFFCPPLPTKIAPEFIFPFDALSLSPGRGMYVFMPYHSYYYPLHITALPYTVKRRTTRPVCTPHSLTPLVTHFSARISPPLLPIRTARARAVSRVAKRTTTLETYVVPLLIAYVVTNASHALSNIRWKCLV